MSLKIRVAAVLAAVLAAGTTLVTTTPWAGATAPRTPAAQVSAPAGYLNLFPFRDVRDAQAWEAAYRAGGHAPWHLSPDLTALAFTQGFLGFREVSVVTSRTIRGADAHIGVGFRNPDGGRVSTAAILHLRRLGTGWFAPWEVVGSDDTSLTITRPGYGSYVTGRLRAGGRITGVDESLHLWVRGLSSSHPLGELCCIAAGGIRQPWAGALSFRHGPDRVVTIVVATGGHVAAVERFAITAVRTSRGAAPSVQSHLGAAPRCCD